MAPQTTQTRGAAQAPAAAAAAAEPAAGPAADPLQVGENTHTHTHTKKKEEANNNPSNKNTTRPLTVPSLQVTAPPPPRAAPHRGAGVVCPPLGVPTVEAACLHVLLGATMTADHAAGGAGAEATPRAAGAGPAPLKAPPGGAGPLPLVAV